MTNIEPKHTTSFARLPCITKLGREISPDFCHFESKSSRPLVERADCSLTRTHCFSGKFHPSAFPFGIVQKYQGKRKTISKGDLPSLPSLGHIHFSAAARGRRSHPLPSPSSLYEPDEVVNASGWEGRLRATSDPILQGSGSTPPQLMLPSPVSPPVHLLLLLLSFPPGDATRAEFKYSRKEGIERISGGGGRESGAADEREGDSRGTEANERASSRAVPPPFLPPCPARGRGGRSRRREEGASTEHIWRDSRKRPTDYRVLLPKVEIGRTLVWPHSEIDAGKYLGLEGSKRNGEVIRKEGGGRGHFVSAHRTRRATRHDRRWQPRRPRNGGSIQSGSNTRLTRKEPCSWRYCQRPSSTYQFIFVT